MGAGEGGPQRGGVVHVGRDDLDAIRDQLLRRFGAGAPGKRSDAPMTICP
ncbi:hypothetical protein LT85_0350 [Collimonas arenae]|uniref:Uncharacterized protein n=1 Tax=Collimonas arenae TaxID=279058 RepID=A0A0A1F6S6_9BURK|nr:hypothetical protein LT85_0350 [Collimonas arenae]